MRITRFTFFSISYFLFISSCISQVNLQNGAAQFNLPLYSFKDPVNRLETNITLNYVSGNGLKVSELPSSVGAGWSINCGGMIQRIQAGERDDQKNNDNYIYPPNISNLQEELAYYDWVRQYFPNGYIYSEFPASDLTTNGASVTPLIPSNCYLFKPRQKYQADKEQDLFMFNFEGRHGLFIISKPDINGQSQIRTLVDSKLKINVVYGDLNNLANIRTTISEFHIVDENGIKYIFKDADLSELCEYDKTYFYDIYGTPSLSNGQHAFSNCPASTCISTANCNAGQTELSAHLGLLKGNPKNKYYKDKWHLTKIINPLSTKEISYEYEDVIVDYEGQIISSAVATTINDMLKQNMTLTQLRNKGVAKRLKKIILTPKEFVEFEYSVGNRIDLTFDKSLHAIVVKYDGITKEKWQFNYGYFVKNAILNVNSNFTPEEQRWSRLCLQSIQKSGTNSLSEKPYVFNYYMGNEGGINSAVPPLFSFNHDSWGYYNPTVSGYYSPSLQSIAPSYPPYEPFDGKIASKTMYRNLTISQTIYRGPSLEARNGVLKSVQFPTSGKLQFEFEQNSNAGNVPVGGVRVKRTILSDGLNSQNDIIKSYDYVLENGTSSGWGYEPFIFSYNSDSYYFLPTNDGRTGINIPQFALGLINSYNSFPTRPAGYIGYAARNNETLKGMNPGLSYLSNIGISALINWLFSLGNQPQTNFTHTNYSSIPFNSSNQLPFQYSRVVETIVNGTENAGKSITEFTSPVDYALEVPNYTLPFSNKSRLANWQYGLIKNKFVYDKNSVLVKKTENEYTSFKYWLAGNNNLSRKWVVKNTKYQNGFIHAGATPPFPFDDNLDTDLHVETYQPLCGRVELVQVKEYTYNGSGDNTFTTTNYEYSSSNYLVNKVKTNNSKGELIENVTYYPSDYSIPGPLQALKDNNILNLPVSSQTIITKTGNQKYLLSGVVSEYNVAANNDIKVSKTYNFRNNFPVLSSSVPFNGSQLIPNSTYYKESGSIFYDPHGNPILVNTENGKVSTIYDYDNKIAVATIFNASIENVAYSSFETESLGGWSSGMGSIYNTDKSITGLRSFSGTLNKTMAQTGSYVVTLWSHTTSAAPVVNNQPGSLITTIGDWKLYEWKFANVNTIQISGNSIDEVRLYPSTARMNTATYIPILGKNSECDPANRIIYYEYDELGRLKIIRDEKRNVIKTYEYNYKQQ